MKVAVLLLGVVAGCSTAAIRPTDFVPETNVRVVTDTTPIPQQTLPIPTMDSLKVVSFSFPRNTTADMVLKNTSACRNATIDERTLEFWAKCGIFPIDYTSNIYVGLTIDEFNDLQYNMELLRQYIILLKEYIDISNAR